MRSVLSLIAPCVVSLFLPFYFQPICVCESKVWFLWTVYGQITFFCDPANLCLLIGASDPFTLNSSEDRIFICHSLPIFMSYIFLHFSISITGFPWWLSHKEPACQCRRCGLVGSLGCEYPLEKEMASHSSIPAWEIPWTDKPGELQSMCHERVGHDLATKQLPNYCVKYFQVNCFILLSFLWCDGEVLGTLL